MKNYYEILEISQNASFEIIEKAYKTLAKRYHPDIQPQDKLHWAEIKMKEINEAYTVLSNPHSKNQYDLYINNNNQDYYNKYNKLYSQNETTNKETNPSNTKSKKANSSTSFFLNKLNLKSYINVIGNTLYKETKKDEGERKRDMIAILFTLLIGAIIVLLFWKVPFFNKLLSF